MRVQLIKKLAEMLDGIDLSAYQPGDIFDLPRAEAALLVAEGWAVGEGGVVVAERPREYTSPVSQTKAPLPARAADRPHGGRHVKTRQR